MGLGHLRQRQGGAPDVGLVHAAQPGRHDPPQSAGAEGQGLEEAVLHLGQGGGVARLGGRHDGFEFGPEFRLQVRGGEILAGCGDGHDCVSGEWAYRWGNLDGATQDITGARQPFPRPEPESIYII